MGISPIHTHHMPSLWTDPFTFDPERFSPARAERRWRWTVPSDFRMP